jgi:septum formation protein
VAVSDFIYLASASPRRRQLLEQIGVQYLLLTPEDSEAMDVLEALEATMPGELPADYVSRVTALKLDAAVVRLKRSGLRPAPVLCADTTVALGRTVLGKPQSDIDARRMLGALAGRSHRVMTAVAVQTGRRRLTATSESRVHVATMSAEAIDAYVASGEPIGKAGAYGIQGRFAAHIAKLSGSYSGVMGLPLFETARLLRSAGVVF